MTFLRRRLSAEQTNALLLEQRASFLFRLASAEQLIECDFVTRPILVLLVSVQQLASRRKFRVMLVSDAETRFKQIGEVRILAPTGKLRRVSQPHINDALHASLTQCLDELLQRLFGKSDSVDRGHPQALLKQTSLIWFKLVLVRTNRFTRMQDVTNLKPALDEGARKQPVAMAITEVSLTAHKRQA